MQRQDARTLEARMQRYASIAYARCCDWFGTPHDPERPYTLMLFSRSHCVPGRRRYWLLIQRDERFEELCSTIGHEMFHRVTVSRPHWPHTPWIEEMMAFVSSQWLLRQQGMHNYATLCEDAYLQAQPDRVDVLALRRVQRYPKGYEWLFGRGLSEDFYYGVAKLGRALNFLVTWEQLCAIVAASTLEDWVASLPEERRFAVRRVLDLPSPGEGSSPVGNTNHILEQDPKLLHALGWALYKKGDCQGAITELRAAIQLAPDAQKRHSLAVALLHDGCIEEATQELRQAICLAPDNGEMRYALGKIYRRQEDLPSALQEFQEAVRLQPDHVFACYALGLALDAQGFHNEACAAWQKVLTLDQGATARSAQQMLAKYGSPDNQGTE